METLLMVLVLLGTALALLPLVYDLRTRPFRVVQINPPRGANY